MTSVERFIVGIGAQPWNAAYLLAVGFAFPPMFHWLCRNCASVWLAGAFLLAVLVALRVVPKLIRTVVPFSSEAKAVWASRRNLSKQFDSYAWQKALWMGLGMAVYAGVVGGLSQGEQVLTAFCIVSGGLGLWTWRNARARPTTERAS